MRKKIIIGVGIFAVIVILAFMYMNHRNRTLSPPGEAIYEKNELFVHVKFSRPSVRNRLIFGAAADGALQPYGEYWRLGANEATTIEIKQDVLFNGVPLKAGIYSLYAVPGAQHFRIGVNEEHDRWGYSEPDYSKDVFQTEVPVNYLELPVEQFNIRLDEASNGTLMIFAWSDVEFAVPISLN